MRLLAAAAGLLAAAGMAQADEAYRLPAVGAEMTYRMVSTPRQAGTGITFGQVYTYIVTGADGATLEGTTKPVAMIYGCPNGSVTITCQQATANPGSQRDGNLVTVPVPSDIGDALAKQSAFKIEHFFLAMRKFPVPGPKKTDDPKDASFATEPMFVLTNTLDCDFTKLADFLPFGKTANLTLSCRTKVDRAGSRIGSLGTPTDEPISLELSYGGTARRSLPSGDWDVQKVANKVVPEGKSDPVAEAEMEVADKIGVTVRTYTAITNPTTHAVTDNISELIAYKP
jgi:hypothetical protein